MKELVKFSLQVTFNIRSEFEYDDLLVIFIR